jgi:death-on-curing protein
MIIYLVKDDFTFINQRTVAEHGGNFVPPNNFLHEDNLDYLIEAVQTEMFGEPLYPTLSDKAAVYCYNVICNHIFSDGNKRTGLEASISFLKLNKMRLNRNLAHKTIEDFIIKVASGQSSLEECRDWFRDNIVSNISQP